MKKFLFIAGLILTSNLLLAQSNIIRGSNGEQMTVINELAPDEFKDYKKTLLVVPAFKALRTEKWLTKQFDEHYKKPYHLAEYTEVASGLGPDSYSVEEYKYMVFIQSSKSLEGNTVYSFSLVDRENSIMYSHHKAGNRIKKYLMKILE